MKGETVYERDVEVEYTRSSDGICGVDCSVWNTIEKFVKEETVYEGK
jgi:hypothetical protein